MDTIVNGIDREQEFLDVVKSLYTISGQLNRLGRVGHSNENSNLTTMAALLDSMALRLHDQI